MKTLGYTILAFGFAMSFSYGLLVGKYEIFPYQQLKAAKHVISKPATSEDRGSFDEYFRLIAFPGKIEVPCPTQTERTGVVLVIGQSNAANTAKGRTHTKFPQANLNYFDRRCYVSKSPLLGTTNQWGEWITLLGDQLIEQGVYDNIVLIPSAIGGSVIARWAEGGDLNDMVNSVVQELNDVYRVTDVIWHQGEGDVAMFTRTSTYVKKFESLIESLAREGVDGPYFMSIASLCSNIGTPYANWVPDAQQKLIDTHENIMLGVNTDEIVPLGDRYDGCHFSEKAQEIVAEKLASSIARYRATQAQTKRTFTLRP